MRILKKVISHKKKVFAIKANLDPHTDDCWNIYNLLSVGDYLTGTVRRRV